MNNNYDPNQQPQYQQSPQYQPQYQAPDQQYQQEYYRAPDQQYYQQPMYQEPVNNSVLPLSIVGACFSFSVLLSLVGLIITSVAKGKIKRIYAKHTNPGGRVKAARIISNIGFGFGLGFTIYFSAFYLLLIISFIAENL